MSERCRANLIAQKNILTFEACDILRHVGLWRALSFLIFRRVIVAVSRARARRVAHYFRLTF